MRESVDLKRLSRLEAPLDVVVEVTSTCIAKTSKGTNERRGKSRLLKVLMIYGSVSSATLTLLNRYPSFRPRLR